MMRPTTAAVVLSLLLACGARGQQAPEPPPRAEPRAVTVQATAVVEREPDRAVLDVAVETFAEDARAAAEENARTTAAVIAALREAGIPEDRIRTIGYNLRPEYEVERDPQRRDRRLAGYRTTNTVQITIDDLDRAGAIIDTAIDAGADRVMGLRFELADPQAARRDALREAVAAARADAEAIATAAGLRLGALLRATTGEVQIIEPRPAMFETAMADRRVTTPIEPGPLRASATVTAVYALEPR